MPFENVFSYLLFNTFISAKISLNIQFVKPTKTLVTFVKSRRCLTEYGGSFERQNKPASSQLEPTKMGTKASDTHLLSLLDFYHSSHIPQTLRFHFHLSSVGTLDRLFASRAMLMRPGNLEAAANKI